MSKEVHWTDEELKSAWAQITSSHSSLTAKPLVDATGGNVGEDILYVSVVPEPGTICPACGEKTPNKHALEMRAWRKKRKKK